MVSFLEKECNLKFFHEHGYIRKCCKICGDYFWTLDKSEEICGDRPCVEFSFIGNPIGKKGFSLNEVRDIFF